MKRGKEIKIEVYDIFLGIIAVATIVFILFQTGFIKVHNSVIDYSDGTYIDKYGNTIVISSDKDFIKSKCGEHEYGIVTSCADVTNKIVYMYRYSLSERNADYVYWHEVCHILICGSDEDCAIKCGNFLNKEFGTPWLRKA